MIKLHNEDCLKGLQKIADSSIDLILILPRRKHNILCIEMKTEKGRQSDRQKQWQECLKPINGEVLPPCYMIAHSLEEFIKIINWYLKNIV